MMKRVSSNDVAKEAGVSRATVSYVLNNVQGVRIKPETKEKVLTAAKRLNYHPDSMAVALKRNRSMCIGVASRRDIDEERYTKVLKGIRDVLAPKGYAILICSDEWNDKGYPEYLQYYYRKRIDGILLLSHIESIREQETEKVAAILRKEKIPSVLIDYHHNSPMVNCVDINYFHGGYIGAEFLIQKGVTQVVYLDSGTNTIQEKERIRGVRKAFEEAGREMDRITIVDVREDREEGSRRIQSILAEHRPDSAIMAGWVRYGFCALNMLNTLGYRIPQDIQVISLAGSSFSDLSYPRLTASELPLYEIGKKSAEVLLATLEEEVLPVRIQLPCRITARETTK